LSTYRGRNTRRITLTFHFVSTHDRTVTKAVKRMQQTNRQSSEPTENRVSVDTASHLYAAHAIRMSQKTARSKVRSEAQTRLFSNLPTCPQKIPLPSGSTIEPFGCNNIFRKAVFPLWPIVFFVTCYVTRRRYASQKNPVTD
jgi:hypothetical protein